MKVLIVEDDTIARFVLKNILSPYGDCDEAGDGKEAVDAFQTALEEEKPYDLICLDIIMPVMDGHEALKKIRGMEKERGILVQEETRVIMISALNDKKQIAEAYQEDGATSYLIKPVKEEQLVEEIRVLGLIK